MERLEYEQVDKPMFQFTGIRNCSEGIGAGKVGEPWGGN